MLGLALVSNVFLRAERDSINKRISTFTTRIASVLKEEAQLGNGELSTGLVRLLMLDPAIQCVELIGRSGHVLAEAPRQSGCQKAGNRKTLLVPFSDSRGSQLRVQYDEAEIATSEKRKEQFSALAMLIGLFVAMGASWFSFRSIVGRPMKVLLKAIRNAGASGTVAIIEHPPADEMGEVIEAFNEMQVKLGEEARRNRQALEHVDRLYNETPALMFSIDSSGLILNVSGHWLEQTGYARKDVLGKAISGFLRCSSGDHDSRFLLAELPERQVLRDIPMQLVRGDGTGMDVLLSAVADKLDDDEDTCFLCVLNDVSSLKESQTKLRTQVVTDLLTGLPNRQGLFEYLAAMKPASEKFMERVAILYIDLDNFKWVNETHGHE
ncbi:MAG: diguanylate cyclase, partial [Aestuariivirga sp.]